MIQAIILAVAIMLSGCTFGQIQTGQSAEDVASAEVATASSETSESMAAPSYGREIRLAVNGTDLAVEWEDNSSVQALAELLQDGPITVNTTRYGGFEQVGSLPQSLQAEDVQTQTQAGDIVLYSGDSLVLFYGSNTWAYTSLGHFTDLTADEITDLLSAESVAITLSLAE